MPEGSPTSAAQSGDGAGTSLQVSPLAGSARIARFVTFLHRDVGATRVDIEPQPGDEYTFQIPLPLDRIIEALLDSIEFRPQSLRSFAGGRLQVRLPAAEQVSVAAPASPEAGPVEPQASSASETEPLAARTPEAARTQPPMPQEASEVERSAPEAAAAPAADERQLFDALTRLSNMLDASTVPSDATAPAAESIPDEPALDAEPSAEAPMPVASVEAVEAPPTEESEAEELPEAAAAEERRMAPQSEDEDPAPPVAAGGASGEAGVQLIARPFSNFGQLNRFITAIGGLTDVRSVTLRRFRDGTLWLAVDCSDAAAFGARLRGQSEIPVDVLSESAGTIEVTVREESRQAASA